MYKLSVVIPVLNQHDLTHAVVDQLFQVTDPTEVEIVVIDNGSTVPFMDERCNVLRFHKTLGVYPSFKDGFSFASGEIVAFFHSDLVIWENDWFNRVIEEFDKNERLGMIGFIGSNEIDPSGGRGLGTTSNFKGKILSREIGDKTMKWFGSPASIHGKVSSEFSKAVVVDGCAMIIRRKTWDEIGYREDFPPHHFYDRLISTQLLELGWQIGVLGIECDHFSGQTVSSEDAYHEMAKEWALKYLHQGGYVQTNTGVNWDGTIYQEAERRWLKEYRDDKHIVPIKL